MRDRNYFVRSFYRVRRMNYSYAPRGGWRL